MRADDFRPDGTLYPDCQPPDRLNGIEDQVDFLVRLCGAWDFGVLPDPGTVDEIRRPEWKPAVDACNMLTSPAYHLLLSWHGLPERPYLGRRWKHIDEDPQLHFV
ncbi:MAG: hypothetical protein AB1758_15385 [Candidatus Eremiobacterota bacterium]